MTVNIGSQYESRRKDLIRRIRNEDIIISETDSHVLSNSFSCYFCCKRINGRMKILTDFSMFRGRGMKSEYRLHHLCYCLARYYKMSEFSYQSID